MTFWKLAAETGFLICLLSWATPAAAEEYYFCILFGSQSEPIRPKYAHSFASVIKATGHGPNLSHYRLEVYTISWLPRTLDIHVWWPFPEPGVNLGLKDTLDWALSSGEKIALWGPYQIREQTFLHAIHRVTQLNSGQISYKAIDPIFRTAICDCIHAISDIDPLHLRLRYPLTRFGHSATHHIARVMCHNGVFLNPGEDHCWLLQRLGLDRYPIMRRHLPRCTGPQGEPWQHRILEQRPRFLSCFPEPDMIIPGCEANQASQQTN